jgi:CRISPR/Cas system-associated exonuclease Cas4 (RecB family)
MATLRNTFAWSRSRDGRFRECLRAYWFTYYGAWGGWRADAPARTRTLYRLKNLRSRPMWAGDVVHRCIERALGNVRRGIEPLDPEAAIAATIGSMRDEWRRSRAGAAKERLAEHEYAIPVPDVEWQATADHVRHCLWSFYGSPVWETLRRLPPERWLEIEDLSSFDLEGTKIWVKLDAAWRDDDGHVVLADWKTGRSGEDDHSMQVATYVLYASRTWDVPATEVEVLLANLATGTSRRIRLPERALDAALSRIRTSIRDMRQLLADPEGNAARETDFPPVDRPRTCRRCAFRRVCVEEGIVAPLDRARDGSL